MCLGFLHDQQPIREEVLLTGALELTNEWYVIAKIAGIKLCEALRMQYGFDAISLLRSSCPPISTGLAITTSQLTVTGYQGAIDWDSSKPDGTPKKQLDVSRLAALGWRARIPLAEGLASTVALFRQELAQQLVRL